MEYSPVDRFSAENPDLPFSDLAPLCNYFFQFIIMYLCSLLADAGITDHDVASRRSLSDISSDSELDEIDDILAFSR